MHVVGTALDHILKGLLVKYNIGKVSYYYWKCHLKIPFQLHISRSVVTVREQVRVCYIDLATRPLEQHQTCVCVHGKGEKLDIIRSLTPQWRQLGLLMDFDKDRIKQ